MAMIIFNRPSGYHLREVYEKSNFLYDDWHSTEEWSPAFLHEQASPSLLR